MPIDYRKYPPNWKSEIRPRILNRANNCCEFCGVQNYAVGYRTELRFIPTSGNEYHDKAGNGELNYKEAREFIKHCNGFCDDNLIMIVLTIAHLDHDESNWDVNDDRLKALCQLCHLRYDAKEKQRRIREKQTELMHDSLQ